MGNPIAVCAFTSLKVCLDASKPAQPQQLPTELVRTMACGVEGAWGRALLPSSDTMAEGWSDSSRASWNRTLGSCTFKSKIWQPQAANCFRNERQRNGSSNKTCSRPYNVLGLKAGLCPCGGPFLLGGPNWV